jgi:hypothetical protein
MGRYGKMTTGAGRSGYSPPNYSNDYHSYSDKGREEGTFIFLYKYVWFFFFI